MVVGRLMQLVSGELDISIYILQMHIKINVNFVGENHQIVFPVC